jgi:hypothetical protein
MEKTFQLSQSDRDLLHKPNHDLQVCLSKSLEMIRCNFVGMPHAGVMGCRLALWVLNEMSRVCCLSPESGSRLLFTWPCNGLGVSDMLSFPKDICLALPTIAVLYVKFQPFYAAF